MLQLPTMFLIEVSMTYLLTFDLTNSLLVSLSIITVQRYRYNRNLRAPTIEGELAQMVERSLCM